MEERKCVLTSLRSYVFPPILMGDDSLVETTRQGRVVLENGIFENVLHILKLFASLLLVHQMSHSRKGKKFEFTPKYMTIFDMEDNSMVGVGDVNYQNRLYTFSEFVAKSNLALFLMHRNHECRLWNDIFFHLYFRYM